MKRFKDLLIIMIIYIFAYLVGYGFSYQLENIVLRSFLFDTVATIVVFIFSVMFVNSSVYDIYWSLTPMVMSVFLFIQNDAFSLFQILFLIIFNIWSLRLSINWIMVFTDFSYEDWRYRKFRKETPKVFWPLVNFFGIHYMPTLMVFLGMIPIFKIIEGPIGIKSVGGLMIIILGILLEFFADRDMHAFLKEKMGQSVCKNGLWKYSRHPNYLGEILVWVGVYFVMLPYFFEYWYYLIGFVSIAVMFNVISIPLMEKRQRERRSDYEDYCKTTSRLLIRFPAEIDTVEES